MSLNRVVLVGRLTKDPELRYTPNGVAVANFTVAANRPFKQDGQQQADFINCVTWRGTAENLANYMKKGSQVGVDGRIQTRTFEGKDGKTVFVTEILAESVKFLESKSSSQGSSQGSSGGKQSNYQNQNNSQTQNQNSGNQSTNGGGGSIDIQDDDLPF